MRISSKHSGAITMIWVGWALGFSFDGRSETKVRRHWRGGGTRAYNNGWKLKIYTGPNIGPQITIAQDCNVWKTRYGCAPGFRESNVSIYALSVVWWARFKFRSMSRLGSSFQRHPFSSRFPGSFAKLQSAFIQPTRLCDHVLVRTHKGSLSSIWDAPHRKHHQSHR